jgi:prevent-host-death family protein
MHVDVVGRRAKMTVKHSEKGGRFEVTITEPKAKFGEMIRRVEKEGPQRITMRGKEAVVVVSVGEWSRKTKRKGSLAEFFANSPLRGAELDVNKKKDLPRDIKLQHGIRRFRGKIRWEGNLEESRRS